jgi:hypothetical protein
MPAGPKEGRVSAVLGASSRRVLLRGVGAQARLLGTFCNALPMIAKRIARVYLYVVALLLIGLAVVRFFGVVPSGEGGVCGPGHTFEYDGPCDAALKARQVEVLTELVLGGLVLVLSGSMLRDAADTAIA